MLCETVEEHLCRVTGMVERSSAQRLSSVKIVELHRFVERSARALGYVALNVRYEGPDEDHFTPEDSERWQRFVDDGSATAEDVNHVLSASRMGAFAFTPELVRALADAANAFPKHSFVEDSSSSTCATCGTRQRDWCEHCDACPACVTTRPFGELCIWKTAH